MSRLDELPPDQRAALSLLLRQRKSYADVAVMLGIAERAVHDRAHAALAVLAPSQARGLSPDTRAEIGDYLLGQQSGVAERLRTRTRLSSEAPGRAWAVAIAEQLAPLAGEQLAEIPEPIGVATGAPSSSPSGAPLSGAGTATAAPAAARPERVSGLSDAASPAAGAGGAGAPSRPSDPSAQQPPSSRLGGALLLVALIVAVAVAVILIVTSGGGSSKNASTAKASTTTSTGTKSGPAQGPRLALHSPSAGSRSLGVVDILTEGGKRVFYIDAEHLPETHNFFYAIWLYNSPTSAEALSKSPPVGPSHKLAGGALLPANAGNFREILLTRETNSHPTKPGKVILQGAFSLS